MEAFRPALLELFKQTELEEEPEEELEQTVQLKTKQLKEKTEREKKQIKKQKKVSRREVAVENGKPERYPAFPQMEANEPQITATALEEVDDSEMVSPA